MYERRDALMKRMLLVLPAGALMAAMMGGTSVEKLVNRASGGLL